MLAPPSPAFLPSRACAGDLRERGRDVGEDRQRRNLEVRRGAPGAQRGDAPMPNERDAGGFDDPLCGHRIRVEGYSPFDDVHLGLPPPRPPSTPTRTWTPRAAN